MKLRYAMSSVTKSQHLLDELQHYGDIEATASFEDGQIVLEVDCRTDNRATWELRAIIRTFDETAVEKPEEAHSLGGHL